MIRSCSARPLAASMRLVLATFIRSAVRCRPTNGVGIRGKADKIFVSGLQVISLSFVFHLSTVDIPFALLSGMLPAPRCGRPGKGRRAAPSALRALRQACPPLARYLRSLICPLRTGHDSLLLSVTSRRVPAARPGHIRSLSGAMSPNQRCRHPR